MTVNQVPGGFDTPTTVESDVTAWGYSPTLKDNINFSVDSIGNRIFTDRTTDDLAEGTTNKYLSASDKSKLDGIEAGAEVNNISDVDATDLTDGGDSSLHFHSTDRDRANHTGTQDHTTISDYDTELAGTQNVTPFTPIADYHVATKKYVDNAVIGAGGGYELLGESTLGSPAASITLSSLPAKDSLKIIVFVNSFDAISIPAIRFNSDASANYGFTLANNGSFTRSGGSETEVPLDINNSSSTVYKYYYIIEVSNIQTNNKKVVINGGKVTTGAPINILGSGDWRNAASQINSVTLFGEFGNNLNADSYMKVYGI